MGFTPQHDYSLFETRAARGELLPDEDDRVLLELEREELDFELRVDPAGPDSESPSTSPAWESVWVSENNVVEPPDCLKVPE